MLLDKYTGHTSVQNRTVPVLFLDKGFGQRDISRGIYDKCTGPKTTSVKKRTVFGLLPELGFRQRHFSCSIQKGDTYRTDTSVKYRPVTVLFVGFRERVFSLNIQKHTPGKYTSAKNRPVIVPLLDVDLSQQIVATRM